MDWKKTHQSYVNVLDTVVMVAAVGVVVVGYLPNMLSFELLFTTEPCLLPPKAMIHACAVDRVATVTV